MSFFNEVEDKFFNEGLEIVDSNNQRTYYQKRLNGTSRRIGFSDRERIWIKRERARRKREINPEFNVTGIQLDFLSPAGEKVSYRYHPETKKLSINDFLRAIQRTEAIFLIEFEKEDRLAGKGKYAKDLNDKESK